MPQRSGHAPSVDLLERSERPLIVIFTSLLEPRLAKDLPARGVDDIVFKPVDYKTFAAKIRSLVNRRGTGCGSIPPLNQADLSGTANGAR